MSGHYMGNWVLASKPNHLWNFYQTAEEAAADKARADASYSGEKYEPMLYDDYMAAKRRHYLDEPAVQITGEQWEEMLGVLPPIKWEQRPGCNSFLMSECYDGPYTNQYVRFGRGEAVTYWRKMVDATDRGTWLTEPPVAEERQWATEGQSTEGQSTDGQSTDGQSAA